MADNQGTTKEIPSLEALIETFQSSRRVTVIHILFDEYNHAGLLRPIYGGLEVQANNPMEARLVMAKALPDWRFQLVPKEGG